MTAHLENFCLLLRLCLFYVGVSVWVVISSIGFGGGVVAIVQPIHAPMAIMAMNAMVTGVAMSQNWTSAVAPRLRKEMM
jgi:hypothetical protein